MLDKEIVISIKTVLVAFLFAVGLYVIYKLGPIFGILLVSTLLVLALEPAVKAFMKITFMNKPLTRGIAVLCTYLIFVAVLIVVFTVGIPPVINQAQKLVVYLSNISMELGGLSGMLQDLLPKFSDVSTQFFTVTYSVFSHVFTFLSILVLAIYMSLDWENLKERFVSLFSGKTEKMVAKIIEEVEVTIGHWIKGQLTLMLAVGTLSFLGLLIVGVNYPLPLALLAGLLEIVPMLGPLVSAMFATIIGFAMSPVKGFIALTVFFLVQQFENSFLVPKVMQKVSGFSPLVVLLAILIGGNFFGIVGGLLAIPVMMIGFIIGKRVLGAKR